ncbi:MAG: ribosomal protein S18-alanine N-acetyltransferase [Nitrospiraceae bacterium]|nr:ribosomal protein S18-alanine N-acetyltransferase [Nitrospiraceae bacterium]
MGKKTNITIDFMRKEDIDQVMSIEQASFSMPWSRNLFLSEFRSPGISTLMVALADGPVRTVGGYIVIWLVEDEMHILNLAVTPSLRRQGIARKLVLAAIKRADQKGAKRAFLEVRASNAVAQKLYLDLGFTGTSLRRDYYDAPVEDAVIMALEKDAFEVQSRTAE